MGLEMAGLKETKRARSAKAVEVLAGSVLVSIEENRLVLKLESS